MTDVDAEPSMGAAADQCVKKCPTDIVGLVVGKEHHKIKKMLEPYGGSVSVDVARNKLVGGGQLYPLSFPQWLTAFKLTSIKIYGSPSSAVHAVSAQIEESIEQCMFRAPNTHCLVIPFNDQSQTLVDNISRFKQQCIDGGIASGCCVDTKQLQFRLLVLKIYDEAMMQKVDDCIIKSMQEASLSPFTLTFRGTYVFNSDRVDKAHMIFTHAGERCAEPQLSQENRFADEDVRGPTRALLKKTIATLQDSQKCVKNVVNKMTTQPTSCKGELVEFLRQVPPVVRTLESLMKVAAPPRKRTMSNAAPKSPTAKATDEDDAASPAASTVASPTADDTQTCRASMAETVTGPEVSWLFHFFDVLVNNLVDAGCLTDVDLIDRRIVRNQAGHCTKSTLSLHLPLVCPKWQFSRRNVEPLSSLLFDARPFLNEDVVFGTAFVNKLRLLRCGERRVPEKEYILMP